MVGIADGVKVRVWLAGKSMPEKQRLLRSVVNVLSDDELRGLIAEVSAEVNRRWPPAKG